MWVKLHGLVVWVIRSIQWQEALDGLVGICLRRFLEEQSLPASGIPLESIPQLQSGWLAEGGPASQTSTKRPALPQMVPRAWTASKADSTPLPLFQVLANIPAFFCSYQRFPRVSRN